MTPELAKGNEIRLTRAALRREIADLPYAEGTAIVRDVITRPREDFLGMRVEKLLRSLPYYGPERTRLTLRKAKVPFRASLATLTPRQRQALCSALKGSA